MCSSRSNWQYGSICKDNCLVPIRWQAIIWASDGLVYWRICASLGLNEKWKHFPRYWPFVRGIHRSPLNSPHKGQWRGALMFYLISAWINVWVKNGEAGDLRRYRAYYDIIVMSKAGTCPFRARLLIDNVIRGKVPCGQLCQGSETSSSSACTKFQ